MFQAVLSLRADRQFWIWHLEIDTEETSFVAPEMEVDGTEPDQSGLKINARRQLLQV